MTSAETSLELVVTARSALAVIAHPDDESFGLGGVLSALTGAGTSVRVLCFSRGEASTLGAVDDLGSVRAGELALAASALGVEEVALLDFPDGGLIAIPPGTLEREVADRLGDADLVVVFEPGGVTGHPDHQAVTAAAEDVARRRSLTVLEWGVAPAVARALNHEFGTDFVAFDGVDVRVGRAGQWAAIRCHSTQAHDKPVLRRRLALQGGCDRVRLLRPADPDLDRPSIRTFAATPQAHIER